MYQLMLDICIGSMGLRPLFAMETLDLTNGMCTKDMSEASPQCPASHSAFALQCLLHTSFQTNVYHSYSPHMHPKNNKITLVSIFHQNIVREFFPSIRF